MKIKFFAFTFTFFLGQLLHAQCPLGLNDTIKYNSITYALVANYPFNGNANDNSGIGNHGTVYGATLTTDRFGNANSAYLFDGSNDYIEVKDHNSLDVTDSFSISLWLNQYSNVSQGYRMFDKTTIGVNDGYNFDTYDASGSGKQLRLVGGIQNVQSNSTYNLNTWNQVLAVHYKDSTSLYQNGVFLGKQLQQKIKSNSLNLTIGSARGTKHFFDGKLDDIRLYNRALCGQEIKTFYGLTLIMKLTYTQNKNCKDGGAEIKVINPQGNIQYTLLKKSDSSVISTFYTSSCTDTIRFYPPNSNFNTDYIISAKNTSSDCINFLDTVIQIYGSAGKNISRDTSICVGNGIFLQNQIRYTSGIYYDTLKMQSGCDSIITTNLKIGKSLTIDSVIYICDGDSVLINGSWYSDSIKFSKKFTTFSGCDSTINYDIIKSNFKIKNKNYQLCGNDSVFIMNKFIKTDTTIYDTISYVNSCDSLITYNIQKLISPQFDTTVEICEGESVKINNITYHYEGLYELKYNKSPCDSIVNLNVIVHPNTLNIPSILKLECDSSQNFVDAGLFKKYLWGNGDTTSIIYYHNLDPISITVTDYNDCSFIDYAIVVLDCPVEIYFPNSFTPNGDGKNDLLVIYGNSIKEFKYSLYNRWGQLVFETDKFNTSWNGKYNEEDLIDGVYIWLCRYKGLDNKIRNEKGVLYILK